MSVYRDDIVAYLRQASQEECAELARVAGDYSKVPLQFRTVFDLYKNLSKEKQKLADRMMERSLVSFYEIVTGDRLQFSV